MSYVFSSPLARRLAKEMGIDLSDIGVGSGPHGSVIAKDVLSFKASPSLAPNVLSPVIKIPNNSQQPLNIPDEELSFVRLSPIQQVVAKRLLEAKQNIPHFYVGVRCFVDNLLAVRKKFNKALEEQGEKITVNDLFIFIVSRVLKKHPLVNSLWVGDGKKIAQSKHAHISIAVAHDGMLYTPVVKRADELSLVEISQCTKALIKKCRTGKLVQSDYQGGSFSVSNLGGFGVDDFLPIVNPPQSAIIGIGGVQDCVRWEKNDLPVRASQLGIRLAADHRVMGGVEAAMFLKDVKECTEDMRLLLLN